jgi:LmbE family N-acetylglucosaminyl deacetylase
MGGTYLKLSKKYKCINIVLTRGEAGTFGTPEQREKESINAAKFAGVDLKFLDFKDNYVEDNVENTLKIARIIRKYSPKIVFAPYHTNPGNHLDGMAHPDHIALGKLVLKGARFAKFKGAKLERKAHQIDNIIYYMVPRYSRPSFIIDITDTLDDLKRLWEFHDSQKSIHGGNIIEKLLDGRRGNSVMKSFDYSEAFILDEPLKLEPDDLLRI